MRSAVLDASAILAFIHREPGGDAVAQHLPAAVVSAVNVAEVCARLSDRGVPMNEAREAVSALDIAVVSFDDELAYASAALRPVTRHLGLSLGDRACLALAERYGVPVVTADREWQKVEIDVDVRLIR